MEHSQQLGEKEISSLLLQFSIPAIVGMMVISSITLLTGFSSATAQVP